MRPLAIKELQVCVLNDQIGSPVMVIVVLDAHGKLWRKWGWDGAWEKMPS